MGKKDDRESEREREIGGIERRRKEEAYYREQLGSVSKTYTLIVSLKLRYVTSL